MTRLAPLLTSSIWMAALACTGPGVPAGSQPAPAPGAERTAERIVTAILGAYAERTDTGAADSAPVVHAQQSARAAAVRSPVTLISWPNAHHRRLSNSAPDFLATGRPYRRAWLDSLVAVRAIRDFCVQPFAEECPGAFTTTFVTLGGPLFQSDTTAAVQVFEVTVDPAACRHRRGTVGIIQREMRLVARGDEWTVVGDEIEAVRFGRC